jgi:large subunit ribosomal protein L6
MMNGVIEPFVYTLKVCSGHFPMNISYSNNTFTVKNFIGEKIPRVLGIRQGVDLVLNGEEITVTSINKELAGQTAASIETLCKRSGFDRRIFQQGIFITSKAGKQV